MAKKFWTRSTKKGQVTIPAEVRRHHGLLPKDLVQFVIQDDGSVVVRRPRYPNLESIRGAAGKLDRPLSWDEMIEIAYEDRRLEERKLGLEAREADEDLGVFDNSVMLRYRSIPRRSQSVIRHCVSLRHALRAGMLRLRAQHDDPLQPDLSPVDSSHSRNLPAILHP